MHEYAIAMGMLDVVARAAEGRPVLGVDVRVGALRQVSVPSLRFAWDAATAGGPLDGCPLHVEEVPAIGRCGECGGDGRLESFPFTCARCGSFAVQVVAGEELLVDAIEVDTEEEEVPCIGRR